MKDKFLSKAVPRGTRTIWRYLGALILLFSLGIGQMWAGVITAAATTDLGKSSTPRYVVNVDGVGRLMKNATGSSSWTLSNSKYLQTGSSKFALQTYNEISSIVITGYGTGSNRTFSSIKVGTTTSNYEAASATGSGTMSSTESAQTITITPSSNIAANSYVEITLSGNVNIASVELVEAGGGSDVCPEALTISSKDSKTAFTEGEKVELTAALAKGNGDISYQWYKGSVVPANAIAGATTNKLTINSCAVSDAGDYYCVASKTSCDNVTSLKFAITVEADPKCFNMPLITSKPADLASVIVTGGTLTDANAASKAIEFDAKGLKFGGSAARLKVTLSSASIVEGTKITVTYECTSDKGSGIAIYNGDYASKTMDESVSGKGSGSWEHTFTAAEAANYADEFMIDRNGGGGTMIVRAITVEDCGPAVTKHTVTLNYNDGETPAGSLKVVHGKAAVKPADPTRGKYTFLGWFVGDTDDAYVWSSAVNDDITLKAHWQDPWTLTFDADGGSAVADVTVKHNTKAEKPADPTKDDNDFLGWFYGDPAVAFDWNANVTQNYALVAHWQLAVAKYDVEYYDGETKIGTEEQVWATAHPTATGIDTDKPLYTFVGWYLTSALEGDPVNLNTVTPVEGLKIYGKWAKAYATSYDMEAYAVSDGASKAGLETALTAAGYAYTNINGIDNGHTHNYTYDGMKYKTNDGDLSFNVVAGKVVEVKTGHLPSDDAVTMYINGVADATVFEGADEEQETHKTNYFYSAVEALYRLDIQASKGTCAIKAVTITDPFTVSFDANGGDDVASLNGTPSVTLPSASKGTDSFLGWFIGEDKIGDAGDSYIPTANVELVAHWEAISTDNTLSDLKVGGVTVDGFDPAVNTYYVVLPYGTAVADIPEISATANSAKAKQVAIQQAVWTDAPYNCYRAQANVQAEDESWGYYDVRFSFAPKDGVSIIKVATTGGTNKTVTGAYAGDGDVSLSSNTKMDKYKYIGFILDGTTLQDGDRINVHTTEAANTGGSHIIFYDNMTDKNELYDTEEIGGEGDNIFTINAAMVGSATAYVYRANNDAAHQWNGYVDYIEVTRAMNPVMTAITLDGVAADKDSEFAFSATLPNGTNLASMTVVPTIIKNGEGGSAAPTAAWAWGANTYRVTDKDGDYTDYTITLTEAAAPSAAPVITAQPVGANYLEGATIAALEVVATGESLTYQWYLGDDAISGAESATYTPAVSAIGSYVYHCVVTNTEAGHPATSLASDNATITIAEDPAAIKLLDGEGNVNTTDFITAVSKNTVNYGGADHNCATFGSTASTAVGASGLNKFIIYNAKTDQTKIKFVLYNTQNSAQKLVLQKLAEGGDAMEEIEIDVPSKEEFTTDFYTFNGSANRTMYAFVKNTGIKVLQVKVIDNGAPLKQFGEVGYSINFNQGRLFLNSGTDGAYDGLTYNAASNFAPLSSTGLSLTKNKAYRFNVPAAATMTVTAANNAKYYITQTEDGEDNETAVAAATSFDLTAGTWYLRVAGSNLGVTNIAFAAPKCAEPVIDADPESNTNFGPGNLTATVVAHATDGATLAYQWYDADDNEVAGATEATLTTTTEGTYYVIITASKAGYENRTAQSNSATLGYRDFTIATLSALSYGGTAIALEADKYEYRVDLPEGTTDVPALAATATQAAYDATAVPTDATEFDNYEAISTVLVTAEDGVTTQTYTVHFYVDHQILALVDVTGNMKWDFSKANDGTAATSSMCNEAILANVDGIVNNDDFKSDNIMATANKFASGKLQASMIKFHTTVPGSVIVKCSNTGSSKPMRYLYVNGIQTELGSTNGTVQTYAEYVPAGDVVLTVMPTTETGTVMFNFTSVEFKLDNDLEPARTDEWLAPGEMGTICIPQGAVAVGADIYELVGSEPVYGKIVFETVKHMKPGKPYMFISKGNRIDLILTDEAAASEPDNSGAMKGTFVNLNLDELENVYYFAQHALWSCADLTSLSVPANRAYVMLNEVEPLEDPTPAPGRVRMSLGVNGAPAVTTGVENAQMDNAPVKMIINGQLFILRGEKMYDVTGKLVK